MESESKLPASEQPIPRPHKALTVPELLATIFSYLPGADLSSVARVCRFWNPVALDLLWQTIPDLSCLLRTFYGHMEEDSERKPKMSNDQWDVFWAYCRRVRTLESCDLDADYLMEYSYHLKSQLKNRLPGPSLLPNLRFLALKVWGGYPELYEVLPIIPAELQVLAVDTAETRDIRSLLKFFTSIPLGRLSLIYINGRTHVELDASKLATFLQPNHSTLVELDIASLPLTVSDLEQIGGFPRVSALGLMQRGPAREVNKFFSVIASSFPKLCWIKVILDYEIGDEVSVAVFEDLMACRELKTVWLRNSKWKKLAKEDVARFGLWWPLMESFDLVQRHHYPGQDTNSLEILQEFARVWSRTLRRLSLPFDGSAPLPSPSAVKFKFEKLAELDVGQSYIAKRSVESVAEFLITISSGRLGILALEPEFENDFFHIWEEVAVQANAKVAVQCSYLES